jgi:hypothetical protein
MHVGVTTIQQYICMLQDLQHLQPSSRMNFPLVSSNYTTHRSQAINFIESCEDQRKG